MHFILLFKLMSAFVLLDVLISANKLCSISKYVINNIISYIHNLLFCVQTVENTTTNMHSSRMRTVRFGSPTPSLRRQTPSYADPLEVDTPGGEPTLTPDAELICPSCFLQ